MAVAKLPEAVRRCRVDLGGFIAPSVIDSDALAAAERWLNRDDMVSSTNASDSTVGKWL